MARVRAAPLTVVGSALILAGAVYFSVTLGLVQHRAFSLALAAVAGIVLLILVMKVDPAWILTGGLVTTMFAGHWEELGLSTTASPHRVLLIAGLLAVMLRAPRARDRPNIEFRGVHFVLAAALAYAVISAIVAGTIERQTAYFVLLDEFGLLPFLMFLIAPVAFATERQRRILLGSLVAVGGYLAVTAVLERLKVNELVFPSYIMDPQVGTHFGRARGPFVEAGADGLALFACAIAAAIALTLWRRPWQRVGAAIVVILAPVGLLLTVTRSVWLAAIIGTFVAVVTTPGLRRLLAPIAIVGAAVVLISLALIPGVRQQARERKNNKNAVYERQNTTGAGLRMIADRPLIGFGWDRGNDRMDPYFRLDPEIPLTGANAGFHNVYLHIGVGLGLLGLGLWLLGGVLALAGAMNRRAPPALRPWQVGFKAFVTAWAIVGLASPASYSFATFLLWTWAGVATGLPARYAQLATASITNGGSPGGNGRLPPDRVQPALV
jgi:putative inorganic carbon (hco3(-)) transporter